MGKLVVVAALAACTTAGLALASPGSDVRHPERPDGVLVLAVFPPERVLVADPRTGATSERRVAGGTLCHGPVLAIGDRVVFSGSRGKHPVALSLPLTLRGEARSLGPADSYAGSPTPGRLWLGRSTTVDGKATRASLRHVDLSGRAVGREPATLPRWSTLDAVIDDGLLSTGGRGLTFLGSTRRSFRGGWLVAARGPRFAWCRGRCLRLRLWSRGGERTLDPPRGLRPQAGGRAAFSPDGRRLAVPVGTRRGVRVAVIDLTSGTWNVVGTGLSGYPAVAWSPSGRWLYFTDGGRRVLAWRLGSVRPVALPIRPRGTVMSIATSG